ncbi:uncharacterized protein LOC135502055 isoform X3 [Lineus longissimus]|uniref:uncharacterized protein LOC135502055 isoform X3 n=1 Tax=Lineus longissimus TaxID=88925 RepID=UPI00315D94D2
MSDHEDSGEVDLDTTPTAEDVDVKKCDMEVTPSMEVTPCDSEVTPSDTEAVPPSDPDLTPSDETDGVNEPNGEVDPKIEEEADLTIPEEDSDKILDEENENEDNASLEVNITDGSSRRASDVSSLSFQHTVLDDPEGNEEEGEFERSRKDSEESTDSLQNEFLNEGHNYLGFDEEFEIARLRPPDEGDLNIAVFKDETMKIEHDNTDCDSKSDSPSDYELIREGDNLECNLETYSVEKKSVKSNQSVESDIDVLSGKEATSGQVCIEHAPTDMEALTEMEADDENSHGHTVADISENMDGIHRNRNSLEIRNNIPNVKEVKHYGESSAENARYFTQGNLPRIRKKSPGLAHRLEEGLSPDGSREPSVCSDTSRDYSDSGMQRVYTGHRGSHNENNTIEKETNYPVDSVRANGLNACSPAELHSNYSESTGSVHDGHEGSTGSLGHDPHRKSLDVENEYDYIKFARIHQGDAYVGMRLAYSSSNDSLNCKRHSWSGVKSDDGSVGDSSRENSPQKIIRKNSENGSLRPMDCDAALNLNDDNLTEIPLNGDLNTSMEDRKITLSPETTECDSAEVESVISEGKDSLGMPNVEDGLSSSQCSDSEDGPHERDLPTPADILRQRQKAEIEAGLTINPVRAHGIANINEMIEDRLTSLPSHMHHHHGSSQLTDEFSRDALDLTMQDIKLAIQKSKSMTLKSPYKDGVEARPEPVAEEPVWVMRSCIVHSPPHDDDENDENWRDVHTEKLQRQEEMRRVRDHIERQQEEEYRRKEQEQVHDIEDDGENLLSHHYTRNDGKKYQPARGFDSDDEYEVEDGRKPNSSRHIRGKRYASVPVGDPDIDSSSLSHNHGPSHTQRPNPGSQGSYMSPASTQTLSSSHSDLSTASNSSSSYQQDNRHRLNKPYGSMPRLNRENPFNHGFHDASCPNHDSDPPANAYVKHHQDGGITQDSVSVCTVSKSAPSSPNDVASSPPQHHQLRAQQDFDTDEETDQLLDKEYKGEEKLDIPELSRPPVNRSAQAEKRRTRAKEGEQESLAISDPDEPTVLIEGVLFRARYLGSTQLISEGQPSKAMRMMQAQEAVGRIKTLGTLHFGRQYQAPEGESQPSTEVDLFVSTEKIMVLNTDLQEIMMDHSLRTISYIADIGDICVIMARRRMITSPGDDMMRRKKQSKIICHVFESEEAQLIAQSIGQAFQVAYMEFLKANGIEDPGLMKEMDYQEVLNQQEIFGEELTLFANKDMQKEVIVPKLKGEALGIVIVESGWGSMVPTVVLANMSPTGAAARCGQLNIGDQIMSINGVSLVGLPLSSCQNYIKAARNQTVVKLTIVQCPPVVEVCIKRPDVKYQLGFSVQNGVICSLLRGGIAERGGVRVGHRIIEINGASVVAVPHEKIVNMLATSVGEIHMKTMPTSIFRLLTGQETPHYI